VIHKIASSVFSFHEEKEPNSKLNMYKLVILSALLAVAAAAPAPGATIVSGGAQYTATYNPVPVVSAVETSPVVAYTADVAAPVAYSSQYHAAPLGYNYNYAAQPLAYSNYAASPLAYTSHYAAQPLAYSAYNYPQVVYQQPAVASYSAATFKPRSGENHGYAVTY